MKRAEILEVEEVKEGKTKSVFKVMLGNHEIGTSKTDFDARFHMHAINDALDVAFLEGQKYLERMVEKQRIDLEIEMRKFQSQVEIAEVRDEFEEQERSKERPRGLYTGGGRCKGCHGSTTYAREKSESGLCFRCQHDGVPTPEQIKESWPKCGICGKPYPPGKDSFCAPCVLD